MGSAGASLDTSEEQDEFWETWNRASREKRLRLGVQIGERISELMASKDKSADDVRKGLATFVQDNIIKKPGGRRRRPR
jgi:hypothetical protein